MANKSNYEESPCGISSYFCTSDTFNNFTVRRTPALYVDAVKECKKENSHLISSKSAPIIALAEKSFKNFFGRSKGKNKGKLISLKSGHYGYLPFLTTVKI